MDVYFKKEVSCKYNNKKFKFDIGNTLFSTFDIDHGTDVLLRAIKPNNPKTILDIGCGYGVIGIVLAKTIPDAQFWMIDRDLLAVRYTEKNIQKNAITNAQALGSVGIEAVQDRTFDLIVSNIPAKLGDEAIIEEFIVKPHDILNPGGELWVVVVNALNRLPHLVERKYKLRMLAIKKRKGHTVYLLKKN
ncbi:MAG: methyltransferase [Candidatus Blackburnbacteria bacterium]|nr:methyltransferase [Candidatus Blackburnbacteria bacterium]